MKKKKAARDGEGAAACGRGKNTPENCPCGMDDRRNRFVVLFQSLTANTAMIDAQNDFSKGLVTWNLFQALKKQIQAIILHHALCYFSALQVRNIPLKFIG